MSEIARKMKTARESAEGLGPMVREVRWLRGLSLPQIERKTNGTVDRSTLSRIENGGRTNPSLATLAQLCVALDIDITLHRDGRITRKGTRLTQLAAAAADNRKGKA